MVIHHPTTFFPDGPGIHTANALAALPIFGVLTGILPATFAVFAGLAAMAGFILYSLQIFDWFERRRMRIAAETAQHVLETAREEAEKLLQAAREAARTVQQPAQKLVDVAQSSLDKLEKASPEKK